MAAKMRLTVAPKPTSKHKLLVQVTFMALSDTILNLADHMDLVCDVHVEVQTKNGTRIVAIDGHGKHEVRGGR